MTEADPTKLSEFSMPVVQAALNSCYRAGWPTPSEVMAKEERFADETVERFEQRVQKLGDVHNARMLEIVIWGLQNKMLDPYVFRLGKLAREDFVGAMYLLGFIEER